MSTRAELEAALAKAEADWRRANERLDQKQTERTEANDAWVRANADRRIAGGDRRSVGGDRRKTDSDRRRAEAVRDEANAAWDQALAARREARAEWDRARAALDELERADRVKRKA